MKFKKKEKKLQSPRAKMVIIATERIINDKKDFRLIEKMRGKILILDFEGTYR